VSTVEIRRFGGPGGGDMDTNDDGRVTEDEFLAPLREAFQRMDEDRDGALDDGERPGRDR
jgi:Ca2+-binding EF-hand superfamily protein